MTTSYRMVLENLETARSWLAGDTPTDRTLGAIVDQLIELVTEAEYRPQPPRGKVIPFVRPNTTIR
jgi:hypothetical protein